jgi:NAD(P)-dependent dehydrogenase (short-subunit alcohol dehydrogenase family)
MKPKGTALITGGAKRIGRSIALLLAEKGYDIALQYNTSRQEADEVAKEIQQMGRNCELFACDFSSMEEVRKLIPAVFSKCPNCNVLINNASIFEESSFLETEEGFYDRHFQINFKTPFFLTQAFAKRCYEGHVINLIDTKAVRTVTKFFAYTLTKKALYEFTKMAAKELAPNIRVNGVGPGVILPPPGGDESYLLTRKKDLPLQRHGDTDCIANTVAFLLENHFITGHCVLVDGGEHLK